MADHLETLVQLTCQNAVTIRTQHGVSTLKRPSLNTKHLFPIFLHSY